MINRTIEKVTSDYPIDNRRHPVPGPAGVKYATEASTGALRQPPIASNTKGEAQTTKTEQLAIRKEHRIATWNVRGLLMAGKLTMVDREIKKCNISIAGLSETHMRSQGHFNTAGGSTLYFSGCEDKSEKGVAILIAEHINKYVLGYNPVSERIVTVRINAKPTVLNIVQIYAPTERAPEEDIERFYNALTATLNKIPKREITIILGDWNAKVGDTSNDNHLRRTVGGFGLGTRSDRGRRLIEYCIDRDLCITNTLFQHHPRRLYTWTSPGARYRNQIDYILVNTRWKSSVLNTKTYPGAECGSDHNLLVAKFALRLKVPKTQTKPKLPTLDPQERLHFKSIVENKLSESLAPVVDDADSCWKHLKTQINTALDSIKSFRKYSGPKARQAKLWLAEDTWELIRNCKEERMKGLQSGEVRKQYSKLWKEVKKKCRRDKNSFLSNICTEIEANSLKLQTADLFKKVRLLTKQFKPKTWVINDEGGNAIHDLDAIAERWRGYCERLYDHQMCTPIEPSPSWPDLEPEPSILRSEITAAVAALKCRKAPGPDQVTAEMLKSLGDNGIDCLYHICNRIWQTGKWPKDWTESLIIPLHKKGSTRECENYRTLALISHSSKILLYIINNRLKCFLNWQIPQEQAGFVKGRGTREQILNVRQIIEKSYEFNTSFVMCFIDYSKAFDCVDWQCLWKTLSDLGVPGHLTALLQSLYSNNQGMVRIDRILSRPFSFKKGVRQGCILSPILFNIYGEHIMRRVCEDWDGGVSIGGTKITNLRYADDTTLFASNEEEMRLLLEKLERTSAEMGLLINRAKTKVMVVDRSGSLTQIAKLNLEVVEDFSYLGSIITNNGSCEKDVRRRIAMAKSAMTQLNRIWADRNISRRTKKRLVTTLVFSIFLYGAETWTLRKADRQRIDAFEMWCWRKMLRIHWTEHRTNESIQTELNILTRLSTTCLQRSFEFFGHIARRRGDNLEKLLLTGKVVGRRPRGRCPTRWSDQIRATLNISVYDAIHAAEDRERWRNLVLHKKKNQQGGHDPQH